MDTWLKRFLEDETPSLQSALIRAGCGNPANATWAKWRKTCGIVEQAIGPDGKPGKALNKPQLLTRRDAVLLICRSQWAEIQFWLRENMDDLDDVSREMAKKAIRKVAPSYEDLSELGLQWFAQCGRQLIQQQQNFNGVISPTDGWGDIEGRDIAQTIRTMTGKPISEDTIRLRCKKLGWKYGRDRMFNYGQILLLTQIR